jgi:hypothetical protein
MKEEIISKKMIQQEVRDLRTDFNVLLERFVKLESFQSRSPKINPGIDNKLKQLSTENSRLTDEILNVRNMFAASTARINNLELAIRGGYSRSVPAAPDPASTNPHHVSPTNTHQASGSVASGVQSLGVRDKTDMSTSNGTVTPDNMAHSRAKSKRPSPPVGDMGPSNIVIASHPHVQDHRSSPGMEHLVIDTTRNTASRTITFTDKNVSQMTVLSQSKKADNTVKGKNGNSSKPQDKRLRGFIPSAKDTFKVFFVSGILRNNDVIEDIVANVREHLEFNGCKVKSVKCVKQSYRTLSLKIVLYDERSSLVVNDKFWPEGINCRAWVDY